MKYLGSGVGVLGTQSRYMAPEMPMSVNGLPTGRVQAAQMYAMRPRTQPPSNVYQKAQMQDQQKGYQQREVVSQPAQPMRREAHARQ